MPIVAFMFASADKVILLILGKQWLDAVPIFRFLMPAAFMGTFNVATGWAYTSLGRAERQFHSGIVISTINVLIFVISVRWGAIGVAAAFSLSRPIIFLPAIIYCYKGTQLRLINLVSTLFQPALASFGAAVTLIGINYLLTPDLNLPINLLIDLLLYTLFYFAIWIVIPNGRSTLSDMLEMAKTLKRK
jgi:O-antigen/teichoic acid export membrane protein